MPQEAGLTRAQRAARAEQRARFLRDADRFERVTKVLKQDSARLYKVEQDMIRDGVLGPLGHEVIERRDKTQQAICIIPKSRPGSFNLSTEPTLECKQNMRDGIEKMINKMLAG